MARINTNVASLTAQRGLGRSQKNLSETLQRLSSGLRINRGADDPAGLIASEGLRSEISGITQAIDNSSRASNVISTAEGSLSEVASLLLNVKNLIVQAANTGALSPDEALPILRDIAAALAYAHEQQLVHRDLKPDNILIVSGHAFLMDFGIAKIGSQIGNSGEFGDGFALGTPVYMAPEQAAGLSVDVRADLYSWGIVAAELLAGEVTEAVRHGRPGDGGLLEDDLAVAQGVVRHAAVVAVHDRDAQERLVRVPLEVLLDELSPPEAQAAAGAEHRADRAVGRTLPQERVGVAQ